MCNVDFSIGLKKKLCIMIKKLAKLYVMQYNEILIKIFFLNISYFSVL